VRSLIVAAFDNADWLSGIHDDAESSDESLLNFVTTFRRSLQIDENGNHIEAGAWVHPTAIVRNSVILSGANVHEFCSVRDSILRPNCCVGHCSEVARSIIGDHVSLPRFNYVGSSIIGERVRAGGAVSMASQRFDRGEISVDVNVAPSTKLGAIVGSGTRIGFCAHINPGVSIGHRCLIGPYVDVRSSVPDDSILLAAQRLIQRPREGAHC
jgi:NDP-sugar pyrophosphorylase family protein